MRFAVAVFVSVVKPGGVAILLQVNHAAVVVGKRGYFDPEFADVIDRYCQPTMTGVGVKSIVVFRIAHLLCFGLGRVGRLV